MDKTDATPIRAQRSEHLCRFSRTLPTAWLRSGAFVAKEACVARIDCGEIHVSQDFTLRHLTAGDTWFTAVGSLTEIVRASDDLALRCLVLPPAHSGADEPSDEAWFDDLGRNSFFCPETHAAARLLDLYLQAAEALGETELADKDFDLDCRSLLRQMVLVVAQTAERTPSDGLRPAHGSGATLSERFVRLLARHACGSHEVAYYADALSTSQKHLTTTLRARTGFTAKQCIDAYLGTMLRKEVECPHGDLKDVARRYGFPTQSYFTQFFVRLTGLTPRDYRKQCGPKRL